MPTCPEPNEPLAGEEGRDSAVRSRPESGLHWLAFCFGPCLAMLRQDEQNETSPEGPEASELASVD